MVFLIILLLILLNAYFSLAEIALVAVKQGQLEAADTAGNKAAAKALALIKEPDSFLSAVQVGITLLGLLEGIYGGDMVATRLQPVLIKAGTAAWLARSLSLVLGIGLITYLTIVIGELLPKSIALQAPLKVSLAIAPSLVIFSKVAYPFIRALTWSTRLLLQGLHVKSGEQEQITEQDIRRTLSTAYQQGVLEKEEFWLHQNVFAFRSLTAGRMMKPFSLVRALDEHWSTAEVAAFIEKYPYSHFPVYRGAGSHIVGVLSVKAFFLDKNNRWQEAVCKPLTVPEAMEATDVFDLFKKKRNEFGLVVDEAGQPAGIVTMQDIMEGIFGDIPELENYSAYFYQVAGKVWQAHGLIHLQRIRRVLRLEWLRNYEEDYLSLAELLQGELGHMPHANEVLTLEGVSFTVTAADDDGAKKIRIKLP